MIDWEQIFKVILPLSLIKHKKLLAINPHFISAVQLIVCFIFFLLVCKNKSETLPITCLLLEMETILTLM